MEKKTIAIIFGGRSREHKISLISSMSVARHLDDNKYNKVFIGIDRQGIWYQYDRDYLLNEDDPDNISLKPSDRKIALIPGNSKEFLFDLKSNRYLGPVSAVFPVLHGPYGEDGTIQGVFEMMGVPYIGCKVLASAICMDKDITKRLLEHSGILTSRYHTVRRHEKPRLDLKKVIHSLGLPLFIKPANLGSSVGITRAGTIQDLEKAVETAFMYDDKILIEEAVFGREIECAVLGGQTPFSSICGEIIPMDGFYSYKAKYLDKDGAKLCIPADLDEKVHKKIGKIALKAFNVLCCHGMARIDFFLKADGSIFLNEVNTIPGFTSISMYPKLLEASGVAYGELLDKLIDLALNGK